MLTGLQASIVDAKNMLNLYLVAYNLRPAARLEILLGYKCLIPEKKEIGIVKSITETIEKGGISCTHQRFLETYIHLNNAGYFSYAEQEIIYHFLVGTNKENLEKLLNAKNPIEEGLALGYPKEAVDAFGQVIESERRDGGYMVRRLIDAVSAGMEIPEWFGYISHIPERFNIVTNDVSETSKALGEKYRAFVKQNNPELALRIQKSLADTRQWAVSMASKKNEIA
ncbi:MAG: hypothetical protein WC852_06335 [Candidatus Nanoarchaeia archaeon]